MKSRIKERLIKKPTLFPWLSLLFLTATLLYFAIGLVGVFQNSEAMMAFLFIIISLPAMIILWVSDGFLRKILPARLMSIWLIEIIVTLAFSAWYFFNHFYVTEFVTVRPTPLIVLVMDKEKGEDIRRGGILQMKTQFIAPESNIITVKEFLRENEWIRIKAETASGEKYDQVYPMSYMQKDTVQCNGRSYPIQFFILESKSVPRLPFSEKQFDSMRVVVCNIVQEVQ